MTFRRSSTPGERRAFRPATCTLNAITGHVNQRSQALCKHCANADPELPPPGRNERVWRVVRTLVMPLVLFILLGGLSEFEGTAAITIIRLGIFLLFSWIFFASGWVWLLVCLWAGMGPPKRLTGPWEHRSTRLAVAFWLTWTSGCLLFAFAAVLADQHGLADLGAGSGTAGYAAVVELYTWHFVDALPGLNVTAAMHWDQPFPRGSPSAGLLVVLYRIAIVLPVLALLRGLWREATPRREPDARPDRVDVR